MQKQLLIQELKKISKAYFDKKQFINAGTIEQAIDLIEDYDLPETPKKHNRLVGNNQLLIKTILFKNQQLT